MHNYASGSLERILCLNSVRLVDWLKYFSFFPLPVYLTPLSCLSTDYRFLCLSISLPPSHLSFAPQFVLKVRLLPVEPILDFATEVGAAAMVVAVAVAVEVVVVVCAVVAVMKKTLASRITPGIYFGAYVRVIC